MDAPPSLHDAVAALLRSHRDARRALDGERAQDPPTNARIPAEYIRRRIDLQLDKIEDALHEIEELAGPNPRS